MPRPKTKPPAEYLEALRKRLEQAVRECPSLDINGYYAEKSDVLKAIRKVFEG